MSASEGTHRTGLRSHPSAAGATFTSSLKTPFSCVATSQARADATPLKREEHNSVYWKGKRFARKNWVEGTCYWVDIKQPSIIDPELRKIFPIFIVIFSSDCGTGGDFCPLLCEVAAAEKRVFTWIVYQICKLHHPKSSGSKQCWGHLGSNWPDEGKALALHWGILQRPKKMQFWKTMHCGIYNVHHRKPGDSDMYSRERRLKLAAVSFCSQGAAAEGQLWHFNYACFL